MTSAVANLEWELRRQAFFQRFSDDEIASLARSANIKLWGARKALFHEGDHGGSLFVILSGRVKITTFSADGKECVLSFAGPGEVLGEISLLDESTRSASAVAMQQTRTAEILRRDFMPILERRPAAAMQVIEVLCERLRATSRLHEDAQFLAASPRLARALLRLIETQGAEEHGKGVLKMRLPQGTLGAYAGLMRESVNRLVRSWEDAGVISFSNEEIVLHRKDELERIAQLHPEEG